MTDFRRTVERRLGPPLIVLSRLPKVVPFLLMAGLLIGGLSVQGLLGAVLLLTVAAVLGALLYLSWPALEQGPRVLRSLVVAVVVVRAGSFLL